MSGASSAGPEIILPKKMTQTAIPPPPLPLVPMGGAQPPVAAPKPADSAALQAAAERARAIAARLTGGPRDERPLFEAPQSSHTHPPPLPTAAPPMPLPVPMPAWTNAAAPPTMPAPPSLSTASLPGPPPPADSWQTAAQQAMERARAIAARLSQQAPGNQDSSNWQWGRG